jgi:hypothetical protein
MIRGETGADYMAVIQGLPSDVSDKGIKWPQRIVDIYREKTKEIVPSLKAVRKMIFNSINQGDFIWANYLALMASGEKQTDIQ